MLGVIVMVEVVVVYYFSAIDVSVLEGSGIVPSR